MIIQKLIPALLLAWGIAYATQQLGFEPIHDSLEPVRATIATLRK